MKFENKVALVTGAGRGIGKGVALHLASQGADIVILSRTQSHSDAAKAEVEKLGVNCLAFQADVTDKDSVQSAVDSVVKDWGKIDFLVNNAGVTKDNLFLRMSEEEWTSVLDVNLTGTFNVTKAVIRGMMKKRFGRIVNIGSVIGATGNPGQANYSTSKAGLVGFTKSLARELGSRNITCNTVAPGFIDTDMTREILEKSESAWLSQIPLGRIGSVQDIAGAVSFLVSDEANYITGTTLHVNGGML